MTGRLFVFVGLLVPVALAPPVLAGEDAARPVGPCSPIAAPDGDIPSELPGCVRRRRAPEGSLADEMAFRRHRGRARDPDPPD